MQDTDIPCRDKQSSSKSAYLCVYHCIQQRLTFRYLLVLTSHTAPGDPNHPTKSVHRLSTSQNYCGMTPPVTLEELITPRFQTLYTTTMTAAGCGTRHANLDKTHDPLTACNKEKSNKGFPSNVRVSHGAVNLLDLLVCNCLFSIPSLQASLEHARPVLPTPPLLSTCFPCLP